MGTVDRLLRFSLALALGLLIYFNIVGDIYSFLLLGFIGLFAITSLVGYCPFYALLGWNTFSHNR